MERVLEDFHEAEEIINGGDPDPYCDKVYFKSNEYLEELFSNFSVEGKEVFSVLASSDQMFYAYLRGAKHVDTFDKNRLTKYYYYLRKWGILLFHRFYPPSEFLGCSYPYLDAILSQVEPKDEQEREAYEFWNLYQKNIYPFDTGRFFFYSTPDKIGDISLLEEVLQREEFSFTPLDLFQKMKAEKQYDVVILSNILEYANDWKGEVSIASHNLAQLVKTGGKVICTHYIHGERNANHHLEKTRFSKFFDYEEFPPIRNDFLQIDEPLGYMYVKR